MRLASRVSSSVFVMTLFGWAPMSQAQPANGPPAAKTGADLYLAACETCHGLDGRGAPRSVVGFNTPLPDFSDCRISTPEPDISWASIIHSGGPARALDRRMPAFGDALSNAEITSIIDYLRDFCRQRGWPHGNLNLPRPLMTATAFPEDESLMTTSVAVEQPDFINTRFVYERRVGARNGYEVIVPFNIRRAVDHWPRGLGDVAVAFKHVLFSSEPHGSIVTAGSEMTFPTGDEAEGLGQRLTVFEPFAVVSHRLRGGSFLHIQGGLKFPLNIPSTNTEVYVRAAAGRSFVRAQQWGRAWTPMVEILGTREQEFGERAQWDLLPEMKVSLSRRQHVLLNAGVHVRLNRRTEHTPTTMMAQVLWDRSEGSLFSGW